MGRVRVAFSMFLCLILSGCGQQSDGTKGGVLPDSWDPLLRSSSEVCESGGDCGSGICLNGTCAGILSQDEEWAHQVVSERARELIAGQYLDGQELVDRLDTLVAKVDADSRVRCRAARLLSELPNELSEKSLPSLMTAQADCIRFWAAMGSLSTQREQAISVLEGFLAAPSETLRLRVIEKLSGPESKHEEKLLLWMACGQHSFRVKEAASMRLKKDGVGLDCLPQSEG